MKNPKHGTSFELDLGDRGIGLQDMVLLDEISEKKILDNLGERFKSGVIYTYIGSVVISVNPYRQHALYTNQIIKKYYGYGLKSEIITVKISKRFNNFWGCIFSNRDFLIYCQMCLYVLHV
jgi:hypothetical protein